MERQTIEFALCNANMEPVMKFSDFASMQNWIQKQIERHGIAPVCKPCKIITTTVMESIE